MLRIAILLILVTACDSPAPRMTGADRVEAERDGHRYVVYSLGTNVEVIRLGYAPRGTHQAIRATMIALVPEVTGCRLIPSSVRGDSGDMRGLIDC